jgi:hypothetical protein
MFDEFFDEVFAGSGGDEWLEGQVCLRFIDFCVVYGDVYKHFEPEEDVVAAECLDEVFVFGVLVVELQHECADLVDEVRERGYIFLKQLHSEEGSVVCNRDGVVLRGQMKFVWL